MKIIFDGYNYRGQIQLLILNLSKQEALSFNEIKKIEDLKSYDIYLSMRLVCFSLQNGSLHDLSSLGTILNSLGYPPSEFENLLEEIKSKFSHFPCPDTESEAFKNHLSRGQCLLQQDQCYKYFSSDSPIEITQAYILISMLQDCDKSTRLALIKQHIGWINIGRINQIIDMISEEEWIELANQLAGRIFCLSEMEKILSMLPFELRLQYFQDHYGKIHNITLDELFSSQVFEYLPREYFRGLLKDLFVQPIPFELMGFSVMQKILRLLPSEERADYVDLWLQNISFVIETYRLKLKKHSLLCDEKGNIKLQQDTLQGCQEILELLPDHYYNQYGNKICEQMEHTGDDILCEQLRKLYPELPSMIAKDEEIFAKKSKHIYNVPAKLSLMWLSAKAFNQSINKCELSVGEVEKLPYELKCVIDDAKRFSK